MKARLSDQRDLDSDDTEFSLLLGGIVLLHIEIGCGAYIFLGVSAKKEGQGRIQLFE